MNELIFAGNRENARYEQLLQRRDALRKEAFQWNGAYVREFGELMLEVFREKMECIRKKKMIQYCQAAVNQGRAIDQKAMQEHLQREMASFQKQMEAMIREKEVAQSAEQISEADLLRVKRLYRKLSRLLHPDMHPERQESAELLELWQESRSAYICNDLVRLQELELLTNRFLEEGKWNPAALVIPDVEKKIRDLEQEIDQICSTDPYTYSHLLGDPELVREKKQSLEEERDSFIDYGRQLDTILEEILLKGGRLTWQMH